MLNLKKLLTKILTTMNYTWQKWTPHLYNLDTFVRVLPDSYHIRIGKIGFAFISMSNPDLSGIPTMLQIRNLPFPTVIGGSIYIANMLDGSQAGNRTFQHASYVYPRPNITSSMISTPSGVVSLFIVGRYY